MNLIQHYTLYKLNIYNDPFDHHTDITTNIGNIYHYVIQTDDTSLLFHTLSIDIMFNFIINHTCNNRRYLILSLIMGLSNASQHTSLIFDLIDCKIYLADPNGKPSFFNSHFKCDMSNKINLLLKSYFIQLKIFDLNYEFISSYIWNPQNVVINKHFTNSIIDNGHCVITSIMSSHYLYITQLHITVIYNLFFELSNDELLYIINSYMNGIDKIL